MALDALAAMECAYMHECEAPPSYITDSIAALRAVLSEQVTEPAFYGFMDEEECCVHLCFTPHCPGGTSNTLPTAYYTAPPTPTEVPLLTYGQVVDIITSTGYPAEAEEYHAVARATELAVRRNIESKPQTQIHNTRV